MTGIADTTSELTQLFPALAAALARDTASDTDTGTGHAPWEAITVVNADVLTAMITLSSEIPAATRTACHAIGEPWQPRDIPGCLRQLPRLASRMHDIGRLDQEKELTSHAAAWLRMVKRALGLRKPDIRLGYPCPWAETRPENHPAASMLLAAGAEGFLRPADDGLRVEWVTSGLIYCPAPACGASWGPAQWPLLGRMLKTAPIPAP
jgi:hypothetical protein